jgi:hypothetical protein
MLPRPAGYAAALIGGGGIYSRVDVYSGAGELLATDLPFQAGSVNATLTSRVTRRLSLSVSADLYPDGGTGLLAPFGNEIRAYRGIRWYGGTRVEFPVFRGRIENVRLGDGQASLAGLDRGGDVVDADFEVPHVAVPGLVTDEYQRLVRDVFPAAEFVFPDPIGEQTPGLIWESDRARACDDLAATAGAFWYTLADGTFTMRPVPWTRAADPLYILADGEGGTVTRSEPSLSRSEVHNSITVLAERTDGTPPVRYTARDTDPSSPTYYLGPFGIKSQQVSVQTARTTAQAQTAAETLLRRSRALAETWQVQCTPDASMELGDVVTIACRGRQVVQVVSSFTLPLTARGEMTVGFRALVPS